MNPLTNVRNITKLNERELTLGIDAKNSWHNMYSSSAWIFIGALNYELSEGDVITVFSQYGEVVNINLIRDQKTGKSKGFCFLCYEDQRSTVLAVDNLNGIKLLNRTIRVDHVEEYKIPKERQDMDEVTKRLHDEGCAPQEQLIQSDRSQDDKQVLEINISLKNKKRHRKDKRRKSRNYSNSSSTDSDSRSKKTKNKSKRRHKGEDGSDYRKQYSSDRRHESLERRKTDKKLRLKS